MSGRIVGEVIAAVASIKARGVTERGFHALIAIAEKCHTVSRQASVPWSWIQAGLYGASKRTAERGVAELRAAGVVTVVKAGFNNNHGRSCSPIYEISRLTDTDTAVSPSSLSDTDTAVSVSVGGDTDKTGDRYRQNDDRYRHLGVVLNGSTNGSTNGESPPDPGPEPNRYCDDHPAGTPERCRGCGQARERHEQWAERKQAHDSALAAERRAAIDACHRCDERGHRLGPDGLPADVVTVCNHRDAA